MAITLSLANVEMHQPVSLQQDEITPLSLSALHGIDWVSACLAQYPEIQWLADTGVKITQEGKAEEKMPYSMQIFGKTFPEFDRTIMTLRCLKLIIDGSREAYETFTAAQKNDRLSWESFEALHREAHLLIQDPWDGLTADQMIMAIEASLVLGDMGKSPEARAIWGPFGPKAPDHDDFHGEVMAIIQEHQGLCPTFDRLPEAARKLLCNTANLAHFGHITHIEGTPEMYTGLKKEGLAEFELRFAFFVHRCDVAGALGHLNKESSIVYTEWTFNAMNLCLESCLETLSTGNTQEGYNLYLKGRADWLRLELNNPMNPILTRFSAMMRLFTPEQGDALKRAVDSLPDEARELILKAFDPQEEPIRTPTYMPAVLVNLMNNQTLGETLALRIEKAIAIGLPFIAKVIEEYREMIQRGEIDRDVPLNFNPIAGAAKGEMELFPKNFTINSNGEVSSI